ncbi:MAG: hypothetical protein JSV84_10005 [Gemmatimonadota bacterium]|nr:MAG: hypothetical protein JSV84_10005 [Gemmatimonadota bacterium]
MYIFRRIRLIIILSLLTLFLFNRSSFGQRLVPRDYMRWGKFGVGKLVTTQNKCNCIADGQMRWPVWTYHPVTEYPNNPEPGERHIEYAIGISFHVSDFSVYYGPSYDPTQSTEHPLDNARVEGDSRTHYRFYYDMHYDGTLDFVSPGETDGVPVSGDTLTWSLITNQLLSNET